MSIYKKSLRKVLCISLAALMCGAYAGTALPQYVGTELIANAASISEIENNNTMSNATNISFGDTVNGSITESDDTDFYQFTLGSSGKINISLTAYIQWLGVTIYDNKGNEVYDQGKSWNSTTKKISDSIDLDLTKGIYYICFSKNSYYNYTGNYNFTVTHTSANESFTETDNGTDNTMESANSINLNKNYKGQIAENDDADFYQFKLDSSGKINISLTAYIQWLGVTIYDNKGNEVYDQGKSWNSTTKKISDSIDLDLTKGIYYICFSKNSYYNYTGNYNFTVNKSVAAPKDNGSKLVDNAGVGGNNTSTWVNWDNITAKANFKGEGGWKYKYSYKNDKDNKWVDMTGYVTSSSYRLPKFTKAGNYTIRIAAIDKYGQYVSKYTYLMVKQDSKKALKDNSSKLSATTVSKGQTITMSSKFNGGVVPYRYKYAYKKNGGSWVAIAQPKHDNTTGYSTDDNFSFKLPSQSGKYTVKVVCRDGVGKTCSKDMNITVK